MAPRPKPVTAPFRVVVDTAEQQPFTFVGLTADSVDGCSPARSRPLLVPTVCAKLKTGDYSVEGMEALVSVERKSLPDLYQTVSKSRERFERLLARGAGMLAFAVVVEASFARVLTDPPRHTTYSPRAVLRTLMAWSQRYRVNVFPCEDRRFAEVFTLRWLQRFYLDHRTERISCHRPPTGTRRKPKS
jgi:DNA excision repair protein ERCC-4